MLEYGNTIEHGTGGARPGGGSGGGSGFGGGPDDMGGAMVNWVSDSVDKVSALPPETLLLIAVVILAGLFFLKRAF